jgi:thiamine biosynthesis lipoprotein
MGEYFVKPTSTQLSRRQFLSITALAGTLLASGYGLASRKTQAAHAETITETRLLMGSIANLTVISEDPAHARTAIAAAFDRMQALEAVFSRFRADSALSRLNAAGRLEEAHAELIGVVTRAIEYSRLTSGAFDVTVEPVHRLYRDAARLGQRPTAAEVERARARVDYQAVELEANHIRFTKPGMALTLDGIAKGYIIDQGAAVLRDNGFGQVLVELGGDLSALGQPEDRPWQIGIRKPTLPSASAYAAVAQVANAALATSGDYLNTFTADRRLNHILDPHSGVSPLELASASVIAPTACDADALATALVVMGYARGFALIDRLPGVEALVIGKDGTARQTDGFPLQPA